MVQKLVNEHYEPERQDKCKTWVYRHHVRKLIPMSERTFWRYMKLRVDDEKKESIEDKRQMKLWE